MDFGYPKDAPYRPGYEWEDVYSSGRLYTFPEAFSVLRWYINMGSQPVTVLSSGIRLPGFLGKIFGLCEIITKKQYSTGKDFCKGL